jgi:hypothetical protein
MVFPFVCFLFEPHALVAPVKPGKSRQILANKTADRRLHLPARSHSPRALLKPGKSRQIIAKGRTYPRTSAIGCDRPLSQKRTIQQRQTYQIKTATVVIIGCTARDEDRAASNLVA